MPGTGTRQEQIAAMTQQLATVFEDAIRAHPADWHMLQRVFMSDLDQARLAASVARIEADAAGPDGAGRPDEPGDGA